MKQEIRELIDKTRREVAYLYEDIEGLDRLNNSRYIAYTTGQISGTEKLICDLEILLTDDQIRQQAREYKIA